MTSKPLLKSIGSFLIQMFLSVVSFAISCFISAFFVVHILYRDRLPMLYHDFTVTLLLTIIVWFYLTMVIFAPYVITVLMAWIGKIHSYKIYLIMGFVSGLIGVLNFYVILKEFDWIRSILLLILGVLSGALYYFLYSRLLRIFAHKKGVVN
jgi:hypothetical protein